MFSGFNDETIRFFLDLRFHNHTDFFHQEHDRYVETVQKPFYELINTLGPVMQSIDPLMEIRPHKCLSRIHRDTRFTKDKSPYRDHLWLLFRRGAEPRDKALFYFFEFGPDRLDWGMGIWGENREMMDTFRRRFQANPHGFKGLIDDLNLDGRNLFRGGAIYKRMQVPAEIPFHLRTWYQAKEFYIGKRNPPYELAFSDQLVPELEKDFLTLEPLYRFFRGIADEIPANDRERGIR